MSVCIIWHPIRGKFSLLTPDVTGIGPTVTLTKIKHFLKMNAFVNDRKRSRGDL